MLYAPPPVNIEDQELARKEIAVYPNPFVDLVTLKNIPTETRDIQLFDLLGRSLGGFALTSRSNDEIQLDLSGIPNGTYLLRAEAETESFHVLVMKQ